MAEDNNSPSWQSVALKFIGWLTLATGMAFTYLQGQRNGQAIDQHTAFIEKAVKTSEENGEKLGVISKSIDKNNQ